MESIPDNRTPIIVVDDDVGVLFSIEAAITSSGLSQPAIVSDSRRVMELVRKHRYQLVLLDLIMPHISGMDILRQLKDEFPEIECVVVTAVDEIHSAVQAIKLGSYDYLVKPLDKEKMIIVIRRALERYSLRQGLVPFEMTQAISELRNPSAFKGMVCEDEKMVRIFHLAETAANTDYNLLITGETGTGKEMLARIIHSLSLRSKGPFVGVNMAASSKALFEDDFFGHIKGAYTGAFTDKRGFFEAAHEGTLFLDEIAELPPALQAKLLRVIQEKEFYPLGSSDARSVDVRIIAASNRDINKELHDGDFRTDLFYRLNMFHIHIPPLRERRKDILPLAHHFLNIHANKNQKEINALSRDLADRLINYLFPGNVRELENIMSTAVVLEKGETITLSSSPALEILPAPNAAKTDELLPLAEVERRYILRVLETTKGNRTQAAKILGIGLRTLRRNLNENNEYNEYNDGATASK
jgi:DNA-binding NtrC family response regulator